MTQYDVASWSSQPIDVQAANLENPEPWLLEWFSGGWSSQSGEPITPRSVLTHAPILQGTTIRAGDVGQLKQVLKMIERDDDGNETQKDVTRSQRGARALCCRPNSMMTPNVFRETMELRKIIWGNGIAWIDRSGPQIELIPLPAWNTWPEYDDEGQLWYRTAISMGRETIRARYRPPDVFHVMGLSYDGIWGTGLLDNGGDTIGYGLGLKSHGNFTFRNGARPGVVIKSQKNLSPAARVNKKAEWNADHQGLPNTAKVGLLTEGDDVMMLGQNNEDAQFTENRKFDREENASLQNLPGVMLNASDRPTFASVEEMIRWYLRHSLGRDLNKWDEEADRKLLTQRQFDSGTFFFMHVLDKFLRADTEKQGEFLNKMVASTIMSPNEARKTLGMNPREGGDVYGNPNTSANDVQPTDQQSVEEQRSEDTQNRRLTERVNRLLGRETRNAAKAEAERIRRAAANESRFGDFSGWLDSFYRDWANTLSGDGGCVSPEVAERYCVERRNELTQLWNSTPERDRIATIDRDSSAYQEYGRQLLNYELGGRYDGGNHHATQEV